jgi:hypothetical protein
MPTFLTSAADHQPMPDGTYMLKVLTAIEKVSERGNEMLVMKLELPDRRRTLPCMITFVPAAKTLVNAFVTSCGLTKPPGDDVETELRAEHVRGRFCMRLLLTISPIRLLIRFLGLLDSLRGKRQSLGTRASQTLNCSRSRRSFCRLSPEGPTDDYSRLVIAENTGVILGSASGELCTIDCDITRLAEVTLVLNPRLASTLRTRGARGCQFWLYVTGERPRKVCPLKVKANSPLALGGKSPVGGLVTIGEFRAEGGQSIIRGIHPTGCFYS